MSLYRLDEHAPQIDPTAWVADSAHLIGRVTLAAQASVWFGVVIRADNEPVVIGAGSNVQEGAVIHTDPGFPLALGERVTVGHMAMLHGCTVGDGALIGIGATVLNGARIGRHCLVGAHALVTEGKEFPDGCLILGSPAKAVRELSPEQIAGLQRSSQAYIDKARRFRTALVRID